MRWEEMRKAQATWEEKRTVAISWEELRKEEKTWDGMRCDEVKKTEKTWDEMGWDEMGWHRPDCQTAVKMGCNEQLPREAAMRWDQMKWENVQHSKDMASDWQVERWLLWSTKGFAASYRHSLCPALGYTISVSILKLPPPACPDTCIPQGKTPTLQGQSHEQTRTLSSKMNWPLSASFEACTVKNKEWKCRKTKSQSDRGTLDHWLVESSWYPARDP